MKLSRLSVRENLTFAEMAIRYLEKLPEDEVVAFSDLAKAINRADQRSGQLMRHLSGYGCKAVVNGKHKWLYGNKKAIAALKKKIASTSLL
jgi:hypothetical protein